MRMRCLKVTSPPTVLLIPRGTKTFKMATLALVTLVCLFNSCVYVPALCSVPMTITIAKDGSNQEACLRGQVPCYTFQYASVYFKSNNSDVILVITYPQEVSGAWDYYFNASSLKIVGQGSDYTFVCHGRDSYLSIKVNRFDYPKSICFENVQMYCVPPLSIKGIRNVEFEGYIGQGIVMGPTILSIKNSTFSNIFGDSAMIDIPLPQNMTMKDSSVIHNDEKGRPLHISSRYFPSIVRAEILIENTNFTLTRAPSPDQPAITQLDFTDRLENTSVNFTISNCQFFNYTSTTLVAEISQYAIIKDVYLNILDSNFSVPDPLRSRGNGIEVTQDFGAQANIHTRLEGNKFVRSIN